MDSNLCELLYTKPIFVERGKYLENPILRPMIARQRLHRLSSQIPQASRRDFAPRNITTMSSCFDLSSASSSVRVHVPQASQHTATITNSDLLNFPAFKVWHATLQKALALQQEQPKHEFRSSPYILRSITVQAVDRFGGGRVGFVKLSAEISNDKGEKLPGSVLLRGGSVAMLVILQPDDMPQESEDEKHVLLTVQPRIPAGTLAMVELPAGMIDDSGTFSGAAAKEIEEELDLKIPSSELIDMTALVLRETDDGLQKGVYTSPGGQDEFMPLFLHQRRVKRESLKDWTGKLTGLRGDGEKITLKCVRLADLFREAGRDAKALSALAMYEGLRKENKLPKS